MQLILVIYLKQIKVMGLSLGQTRGIFAGGGTIRKWNWYSSEYYSLCNDEHQQDHAVKRFW